MTPVELGEFPWLASSIILRVEVGSTVHGISVGADDIDQMALCIEPMETFVTTLDHFQQSIYRSAAVREGRQDAPSKPGDLDLTVFSLRKWCRLALDGNPTVILPLFVPQEKIVYQNAHGMRLRELAPAFASKLAIKRFWGYLIGQRDKLTGIRGQKGVNRRELVERFGFDTKYAGHMLRLGHQGIEFARTGRLTLPIQSPEREFLIDVREGRVVLNAVLEHSFDLERQLVELMQSSKLPDVPDVERVNAWMRRVYLDWWHAAAASRDLRELRDRRN